MFDPGKLHSVTTIAVRGARFGNSPRYNVTLSFLNAIVILAGKSSRLGVEPSDMLVREDPPPAPPTCGRGVWKEEGEMGDTPIPPDREAPVNPFA
jgi:hypothetical protein